MKRLIRFIKAIIKYLTYGKLLDNETAQKHIDICHNCEFYNENKDKCNKCGCYIRIKCMLSTESCPINKW